MYTVNIVLSNNDEVISTVFNTLSEVKSNFNFFNKYPKLKSYKVFNKYGMYLFDLVDLPNCKISSTKEWKKLLTIVKTQNFSEDLLARCKSLLVGETVTILNLELKRK